MEHESTKEAIALNDKGNALYQLGNYQEAIKAYNEALKIDPKSVIVLNNKGNALRRMCCYMEMLEVCVEVINIDENNETARRNMAIAMPHLT
ncbi:hypothetical protein A2W67_02630 [Candidatus Nomurabacteria bacterium RIFCSPLOWO2_02_40_28]|uniref:TPR-repeat protein n=2 Tax=Candidatus Nomuraibacteriota TaxID=1752729 RepID=A0A837HRV4_9BACT|nr:MAG: TPR-repeat protein [Candidatus Nomurabacteria bacterium GW2011_GWD2_39_12]KKR20378.1 MAG: TPR-repeat protein [Candidatus Nomurabacteria bacterium GW2011_GWC2_39_41]KKR37095.1 MAG: TPR-repeat protein [Candidatus Nomurabacteria bacterium GW2011_GWE2_40_10]KKR38294.1 MAG: TPR-repeat protein [Candidatus Nomurabacteria bacterium GW2011_GWB1_40_11]KKR39820.1 MAG: TPR-repeat protein [Parcubacteria group bacterium GW2011_GWC1_40_11]KKR67028.1 MAG: TPR-repeat protein [Parcubacteria group bacter